MELVMVALAFAVSLLTVVGVYSAVWWRQQRRRHRRRALPRPDYARIYWLEREWMEGRGKLEGAWLTCIRCGRLRPYDEQGCLFCRALLPMPVPPPPPPDTANLFPLDPLLIGTEEEVAPKRSRVQRTPPIGEPVPPRPLPPPLPAEPPPEGSVVLDEHDLFELDRDALYRMFGVPSALLTEMNPRIRSYQEARWELHMYHRRLGKPCPQSCPYDHPEGDGPSEEE